MKGIHNLGHGDIVSHTQRHIRNRQSPWGLGLSKLAKRLRCPATSHRGGCPIHTASYLYDTQTPAAHVFLSHAVTVSVPLSHGHT